MSALTLDEVLACPALPSLPVVAVKVLELTRDEKINLEAIGHVVQSDPALCAKILRTINSSFYGLPSPCSSVTRAMGLLGMNTVKSLVLGFSLVDFDRETGSFDLSRFWHRCLFSAVAARRVARLAASCDSDEAFAAGMMQDLGVLAILAAGAEEYLAVLASTEGDHRRLPEAERDAFGFDHSDVGALLAERWRLPSGIVEAIRRHHDDECADAEPLVKAVALGSEAAIAMNLSEPGVALNVVRQRAEDWFGFCIADVNEMMKDITDDVAELSSQFAIDAGEPVDVNWLLTQAEEATVQHQLALEREADSLRRTNDELTRLATTDGLTNIANRKRFDEELASRFDQAVAFKGSLGLILCDADHFKALNDEHGHQVGDAVLVELARRLQTAVRNVDIVCRYGGEEFAVILPGASLKDAAMVAERLRRQVGDATFDATGVPGGEADLSVTISLGAAVYDSETAHVLTSRGLLVKAADQALYVAKNHGRNCVRVFRADERTAAA